MVRFQPFRSLSFFSFHHAVSSIMVLFCFSLGDGISWLAVPDKHTNVQQGNLISLHWHYKMDNSETFLSSRIDYYQEFKPYISIASRHMGENTYYRYLKEYLMLGKNNITLTVNSTKIGNNITYCCHVVIKLVEKKEHRRCSKVFIYAVPRITYYVPKLSCKQSDSIKLQCNTTGLPSPHVEWIHDDTHQRIGSSSDILLKITGKRSRGRYCCDVDNGFGRDTACTTVNVTEYEPVNTRLVVKQKNRGDVIIIHIECHTDASPPASKFITSIDDKQYNSSNGVIEVPAPRKSRGDQIAVSCIPCNKYGQGPIKKVVVRVHAPPTFITPLPTLYNMTVSGITLKCETKGIPTPNITWISGDSGDIVKTKNYNVSYVKCATKTMTFFCHARNVMGNISSPEIRVNVMTKHNCSTVDKSLDGTTPTALKSGILIAAITCACIFVVGLVVVAVSFRRPRIKASKVKNMDENIYQDPIDAVNLERGGPLSLARITSIEDDYAIVEECGVHTSLSHVKTNVQTAGEEPLYERLHLVPTEI